jgi:antitoxin (DNA-binding transcriptional repressor) of toxin-antitoxin stability system
VKLLTTYEAKNSFPKVRKLARREVVIVTNRGKPVAAIEGLKGEDLEDYLLERSPKFWDMIRRARRGTGGVAQAIAAVRKGLSQRLNRCRFGMTL